MSLDHEWPGTQKKIKKKKNTQAKAHTKRHSVVIDYNWITINTRRNYPLKMKSHKNGLKSISSLSPGYVMACKVYM